MDQKSDPFRLVLSSLFAAAGVVLLVLALLKLMSLLLLVFAAVVAGTLIRAFADVIDQHTPLAGRWSFYAALLIIGAVVCGFVYLFGSQISRDMSQVADTLSASWGWLRGKLTQLPGGDQLIDAVEHSSTASDNVIPRLSSALSSVTTVLTDIVLLLFGSVFIAADPSLYRRGLVMLIPKAHRDLADDALAAAGAALRQWMLGQFFTMTFIGTMTGLALWLIGVPSPAALGLLAGFFEIIPYLGPFLSAIPILAMAATDGQQTMLLALALVVGIQQVEGSLVTPYVHKKVVSLPPAVSVFGVVAGGILFGTMGLVFAAPLLIVVFVLIKRLYVEEALDTPTTIPGRDS